MLLASCVPPAPPANPHYVLGDPYRANGAWNYPTERYDLDETGLASVLPDTHTPLTSNGEVFDQTAIAAAHPTLQLPAIARLTNLQTGRSIVLRINDRGSANPGRLLEVTRRVATVLGMNAGEATQVRLRVLPIECHAAADALAGAPRLAVASAPRDIVQATDLPPPPGIRQSPARAAAIRTDSTDAVPVASFPLRLPETVTQGPPQPGRFWVRLDTFEDYQYAAIQRARLIALNPAIISLRVGRGRQYRVQIGPFDSVPRADAVLDKALGAGIPDARIVVE
jgi:rare lipoprotein A